MVHHRAKGSSHLEGGMDNLLKIYISPVTSVQKNFSKDVPTPEMLASSLGSSP
jgi:hypothetical protein